MSAMKDKLQWPKEDDPASVHDVDWNNSNVSVLLQLLLDNLHTCFRHARKKIVDSGYTEKDAEMMILRCGPIYGTEDMVSNIVHRALTSHIKNHNEGINDSRFYVFNDLQKLVEYTMFEMVSMLKAIKRSLSVHEVIWRLLICDLNLIHACDLELDPVNFSIACAKKGTSAQTSSQSDPPTQETMIANVNKPDTLQPQSSGSGKRTEQKCQSCQKGCPGPGQKRDPLRKSFYFDKNHKGQKKRAFKKELANRADLGLDKILCPCDSLSVNKEVPKVSLKLDPESILDSLSVARSSSAKPETVAPDDPKTAEYYLSSIPYDESKGEHVPRDERDKIILAAVSRLESLQKESQSWDAWANKKVMQVTKKLSHERPELNFLRAEKEEAEKLMENSAKKVSEMMSAVAKANFESKMADEATVLLQDANLAAKHDMEAARSRSLLEAKKLEEAVRKEQESIKKCKSIGTEESLLDEELKALKCEVGLKQLELEKAKRLLAQTKINVANEERESAEFRKQAELIRNERECLEALAKAEDERVTKNAEKELKNYENEMKRVWYDISALKLEGETKKVAAMRKDFNWEACKGTKTSEILRTDAESGSMRKKEDRRECVMCLVEEPTVVFAPCGHQVLCGNCNMIHDELNRMNGCPSCRAPIQKRINACFAKS